MICMSARGLSLQILVRCFYVSLREGGLAPCAFISLWNLRSLQSHFIRNPVLACSISESLGTYVEWKWLSIGVSLRTLDFYSCLCVYAFHFCILASVGAMPGFSFQHVSFEVYPWIPSYPAYMRVLPFPYRLLFPSWFKFIKLCFKFWVKKYIVWLDCFVNFKIFAGGLLEFVNSKNRLNLVLPLFWLVKDSSFQNVLFNFMKY